MSPKTIERDAKIAKAIDAIGEASPEAKRMILSGEANINKKELESISFREKEEIEAVAAELEEGTYEKQKQESPATNGDTNAEPTPGRTTVAQSLKDALGKMTVSFTTGMQAITGTSGAPELKRALRAHIDALEEIYAQI